MELSMNQASNEIVEEIIDNSEVLHCIVKEVAGATVIDAGVNTAGTEWLGRLVAGIEMGGLGAVRTSRNVFGDLSLPIAISATDQPILSISYCQNLGWAINMGSFHAIASGPASTQNRRAGLPKGMELHEKEETVIISLEAEELPSKSVLNHIAETCATEMSNLVCIVSPVASQVGVVLQSSRILGIVMERILNRGVFPEGVRSLYGTAPIAPVLDSSKKTLCAAHDCIRYAGRVYIYLGVRNTYDIQDLITEIPSSSSDKYEIPFERILDDYELDIQRAEQMYSGPAESTVIDIETQESCKSGCINHELLQSTLRKYQTSKGKY